VALAELIIGVTILGVVCLWATVKLVKWGIQAEEQQVPYAFPWHMTRLLVALIAVAWAWKGVAHWLTEAWKFIV